MREPSQVFMLLEAVYASFDGIAKVSTSTMIDDALLCRQSSPTLFPAFAFPETSGV